MKVYYRHRKEQGNTRGTLRVAKGDHAGTCTNK